MSKTRDMLMRMYRLAYERFGHQKWWPGQTPLEVCVGAVLTQNTNWTNVEKALNNLRGRGLLDLEKLNAIGQAELAELIRPAGYYNIKAKRLKNFIARAAGAGSLEAFFNRSAAALREELLSINGIGRETADSIMLYAAGKCTFVVDTYTYRVLLRHHLIDADYDYDMIKELLEGSLDADADLFNDFHAQFVAVGKNFCKPVARCEGCPLESLPHDRTLGSRAGEE